MEREDAIARLAAHAAELRHLGIDHLYLFGSTTCGDARADSDVDPVFDHPRGRLGRFQLMAVKQRADASLGRKTDIMTRRSLLPRPRKRIEASAMQVFWWKRAPPCHGCTTSSTHPRGGRRISPPRAGWGDCLYRTECYVM